MITIPIAIPLQSSHSLHLGLVGLVIMTPGLLNTMTMNMLERRRELGMLRALGSLRSQVVRRLLAEALIIGLLNALYGRVFGHILSRVMITAATSSPVMICSTRSVQSRISSAC